MDVVLDSNVIVASLRSRQGASFQIITMMFQNRFTPILSVPLLLEYEEVLKRGGLEPAIRHLKDADLFLDMLANRGRGVPLYFSWRPMLPDPDDDMVLETAIAGTAQAIVTFNARDFAEAERRFGIAILQPATFLQNLREKTS